MYSRAQRARELNLPADLFNKLANALAWTEDTSELACLQALTRSEVEDIPGMGRIGISIVRARIGSFARTPATVMERPHWQTVTLAASTFFHDEQWPLRRNLQGESPQLIWPSRTLGELMLCEIQEWLAEHVPSPGISEHKRAEAAGALMRARAILLHNRLITS